MRTVTPPRVSLTAALLAAAGVVACLVSALAPTAVGAQDVLTRPSPEAQRAPPAARPLAETHAPAGRLPADSITRHTLQLQGRTLAFTAIAGSLPITNSRGRTLAEIAYVAYLRDVPDQRQRPVTFAFNGGPGSASTWLHLGGLGPWRLPLTPAMSLPSATPTLLANDDTWLDFTDLVFIDPVGTGYSATTTDGPAEANGAKAPGQGGGSGRGRGGPSGEEGGSRWFWSVAGDVQSLAEFIHGWLKHNDRLSSPKMIVGESYGGFRGPRIAHQLQRRQGVGINAMVLVSPVLDFDGRRGNFQSAYYVNLLPSIAAAALEHKGQTPTRETLRAVEDYARGDMLLDLMRGPRNSAAVERVIGRVAEFSGLPVEAVRRNGGRLGGRAYLREVYGPEHKVASLYDASLSGFDPYPGNPGSRFDDPFTTGLNAPMTSAMIELYERLGWRVDRPYEMLSSETNRGWTWGNSPSAIESISALREVLSLDPRLRALVTHGFIDLVTPYFASDLLLAQLPAYGDPSRVALKVYPGGHMHYSRDGTRSELRRDVEALLAASLPPPDAMQ